MTGIAPPAMAFVAADQFNKPPPLSQRKRLPAHACISRSGERNAGFALIFIKQKISLRIMEIGNVIHPYPQN
ncbi:hypothetical protein [Noviherbaspirillum cavernae]|uniref:hypothetical protein n=1 Tax=Noviherbaspirillum cavernae TaxID=2320862 RepID=UPI0011C4A17D|nr:hypothetical protein [Noviherbaspirillum cavernae]